jgi:hypothetical protein
MISSLNARVLEVQKGTKVNEAVLHHQWYVIYCSVKFPILFSSNKMDNVLRKRVQTLSWPASNQEIETNVYIFTIPYCSMQGFPFNIYLYFREMHYVGFSAIFRTRISLNLSNVQTKLEMGQDEMVYSSKFSPSATSQATAFFFTSL